MTDAEHAELDMARSVLVAIAADADYLNWETGWIDSALRLSPAQETYWRSLLPVPEADR